jgi:hypothetical protein
MATPNGLVAARSAAIASSGWMVPPPKLWVFSTTIAAVDTWYVPASGCISLNGWAGSSSPRGAGQDREEMPENTAAAPISALSTCASSSVMSSWPGPT